MVSFHLQASKIQVGIEHSFNSLILDEKREIQVYVPDSYYKDIKRYPVIYVMDSQRYFLHAIAHQQSLTFQDRTPEFIVVGIKTDNQNRRKWLSSDSKPFMNFLKSELIPWVSTNYRTSGERLYFGWEMAAGLVPDLIATHPELFQAFFMASPTHINQARISNLQNYLRKSQSKHFIYVTLGDVETWSITGIESLKEVFINHAKDTIEWNYDLVPDQDHYTTPLITIDTGLLTYFKNYPPLRFYTLAEFKKFGGLSAVKQHYKIRAERFDVNSDIHHDTKHYLLNQALKENDLQLFSSLAGEFEGFIEGNYNRDFWFERFANAFVQLGNFDQALKILSQGIKKLPNSAKLYSALGNLYQKQSNFDLAKVAYEKALSLSPKNGEKYKQTQLLLNSLN